jgi:hypothetical protein
MKNFTSLADQKFKVLGLVITLAAVVLLTVLYLLNYNYEEGWHDRIFIINHFIIVFGLYIIMYSKETYDDERVQKIRYSLLKFSSALTVSGILAYLAITTLDRVQLSVYVIIYIIEAVLILYQILFRYFLAVNPSWIFKETTRSNFSFYYLFFSLLFLIGWIIFVVIQYKL